MSLKITCGIPTKGRYDVLDKALLSIAFQTLKPIEVIIVDDTQHPMDLREIPHYLYIFKLFDQYKIAWRVIYGKKQGQHHSHEMIQREAKGDWVFRCFLPEEKVEVLNGFRKIEDIKIGDLVKTHKDRYRKVIKVYKTPYNQKKEILWINTANSTIKCTPEHPFLIKDKEDTKWVSANRLQTGEFLLYPFSKKKSIIEFNCHSGGHRGIQKIQFNNIQVDRDLARFFGLYLAEGCGGHDSIRFTFNNNETEYIEFISRVCNEKFGRTPTIYQRWATTVKLNIRNFSEKFITWFGKDATVKKVPEFVFSWDIVNKLIFVKGYLDGDGWNIQGMKGFASASLNLVNDIKVLLNSCGIDCTEPHYKRPSQSNNKGNIIKNNGSYECRISTRGYGKLLDLIEATEDKNYLKIPISNILEKKMPQLKKDRQFVYNIEVEEDNSYIVSSAIVHNCDDDCVAEPDCLEKLSFGLTKDIGAVAPLVLMPNPTALPTGLKNDINDLSKPNIQWYTWKGTKEADHLYSCFLYRKMVVPYDLTLSNKAHREETIFSHSLKRAGYKLIVNGDAYVWHFRAEGGGIRSDNNVGDYNHDEQIFQGYLAKWGVNKENKKTIVLDNGLGDHYAFKHILPQLKAQGKKIVIAACFPDVFWDEPDVETISIAEAKLMFGNLDNFNIYKYLWDSNREMHIVQAFKEMYGV